MAEELADIEAMHQLTALVPALALALAPARPLLPPLPAARSAPLQLRQPPLLPPPPKPAAQAATAAAPAGLQGQPENAALLSALQQVMQLEPGQRQLLVGLLPMMQHK